MQRKRMDSENCPVARALDVVGDWWTLLIVRNASSGTKRFSDFQQELGISKNILTVRLEKMLADGVMELRPAPDGSRHQEYHLTDKGRRLRLVLLALRQWGEDFLFENGEPMTQMTDKRDLRPLKNLQVLSHDGRELDEEDIVLELREASRKARRQSSQSV